MSCRRFLSIPVALLGIAVVLPLLPLLAALALALDVARPARLGRTRTALLLGVFLVAEAVGLMACLVVWLRTLRASPGERVRRNYRVQRIHNVMVYRAVERLFGLRTVAEGLEAVRPGPAIVLSRHAGYADTFLPWLLLGPRGLRPRFVLKRALSWLPTIDIIAHRLPHIFVDRRPTDIPRVRGLLDDAGEHDAVIIYPEGGRFTEARKAALEGSSRRTLARQAAGLRHLLPPRIGGPLALLSHPRRADVIFCAHVGLEPLGSIAELMTGGIVGDTVRVRFWHVAGADVPADDEALAGWLFEWWRHMDAWIEERRSEYRAHT